ncbi:ankyrin repeat domain-containing protein 29 isoform X2 [Oncorhynchus mykiss]|uniref:ankyrin repeat domain-containing protein 29 isoform X2 n=2 Tax=Oncorhynchus mykiss TaxID=8022 RepID=UPI0018779848|nr:ankyrin repeat domain-containing protein 29 isoform X2 [Oncorhynchus mykiss]
MSFKKETPLANAVFWAARKGNLALLQLLLNSGRVDADCRDSFGTTALMVASYSGHYDCARELIMQGTDINLQREQGHNEVVKLLFEFGGSTEFQTKDGGTALSAACQYGHSKVVDTLLKNGANVHDQLHDGATPLFLASQEGHVTVIRQLLSSGAKVNHPREVRPHSHTIIEDLNRGTDIFISCLTLFLLLFYLHVTFLPFCSSSLHSLPYPPPPLQDGTAPLWMAAQMGHSEVVKVLLLRGADRDADRKDGSTALFKAAFKGHNAVIEELLKFSPSLGLLKNGSTALHAAVMGDNHKSVNLLLGANADPTLPNKNNELPADLTKSNRILRALRPHILNGSS